MFQIPYSAGIHNGFGVAKIPNKTSPWAHKNIAQLPVASVNDKKKHSTTTHKMITQFLIIPGGIFSGSYKYQRTLM